ncbi:MAG: UvrD-helicase domain-containing protein, partial [Rickettsiales bacterium]|nr:UvrD-helicase domain-containing protein [Rickettsiales bacterium]
AQLRGITTTLLQGEPKRDDGRTGRGLATWLETFQSPENYVAAFLSPSTGKPYASISNKGTLTEGQLSVLMDEKARVLRYHAEACALATATRTGHMLVLAETLLALYTQLKHTRALLDYEDLIISATALLKKENVIGWILYKLDGGIDHLLVDEAQDTSPEQWEIINALTEEFFAGQGRSDQDRSIFVVGDEKQSIFSFQGADPRELGKAQKRFSARIEAAGKRAHTVQLQNSYRSTPEVLRVVDAVFQNPFAATGLTYTNAELAHIPTRTTIPGLVEIWPPFLREKEEAEDAPKTPPEHIRLARAIAAEIRGWLDQGLMLESKGRAVEPGDIMILVRKRAPLVDPLVRALKKRGVPVSGQDRMKLEENLAVQDMLALGQCLLLPDDDLSLAALLKSPIFALSEAELFALAHARGKTSLWQRLQAMQSHSETTQRAHDLLTDLRTRADFIPPFELFSYALENTRARARILGRMGEEYAEPLDEFLNLALQYERTHTPSLQGFIHWITSSESEIRRDMEQAQGCVRILTAHASKGLEAPIVILPDMVRASPNKDLFLWHRDENTRLPFWPESSKGEDSFCANLRQLRKADDMAEYRRLLYVALTRARDRLYICGAASAKQVSEESWYALARAGLEKLGVPFTMPGSLFVGEGLRVGAAPGTGPKSTPAPSTAPVPLPHFAYLSQAAPVEPVPTQPLTPSRLAGEEPAAASPLSARTLYARGTFIHRLLQYLPQVPENARAAFATRLAVGYGLNED